MLAGGFTTRRGHRGAYLHRDAVNGMVRGRRGARLTAITSGGAIPDTADYDVVLEPVGQLVGTVHEDFLREFLDQTDETLHKYYRGLAFTGTGFIPKTLDSDADVVAYVARTRGALGYVNSETNTQGVKTLTILRPTGADRALQVRVGPEYPATLRQRSIGGIVRLQLTISPEGMVENVSLLGGNPILAQSAMDAVRNWRYSAARSRSKMEVTIPFNPSD